MSRIAHKFDLHRLLAFVAVSEEGSITAGAVRLGIAQPALSASIRRLETNLGTVLFERHAHGVETTPAGKLLLPRAYEVLSILQDTERLLAENDEIPTGEVSIGLPPSATTVLTYPLLTHLAQKFPQISIRLVEALSGYLRDWLDSQELDLAITFDTAETATIAARPIIAEEIMLIGQSSQIASLSNPMRIDDLAGLPLIVTSSRHALRHKIEQQLESLGQTPNIKFEIDAGAQLVKMVSSGQGFGIFARSAFSDELAQGVVGALPFSPSHHRQVCLSWHRSKSANRCVQLVVEEITLMARELRDQGIWL